MSAGGVAGGGVAGAWSSPPSGSARRGRVAGTRRGGIGRRTSACRWRSARRDWRRHRWRRRGVRRSGRIGGVEAWELRGIVHHDAGPGRICGVRRRGRGGIDSSAGAVADASIRVGDPGGRRGGIVAEGAAFVSASRCRRTAGRGKAIASVRAACPRPGWAPAGWRGAAAPPRWSAASSARPEYRAAPAALSTSS